VKGNRKTSTYGSGKSDRPVVPTKHANKGAAAAEQAEHVEGRGLTKGKASQQNASGTQCPTHDAPSELTRLREAARRNRKGKFTALLHHVSVERLTASFYALKRNAASGVDGVTWEMYRENLKANVQDLHTRVHRGAYRAKPSRRVMIPKGCGAERGLGIATLEDKLVQRAMTDILNTIYEEDFLGFSYGFRPGRGQHDALDALSVGICSKKVNWVLDADIRGFFDAIEHEWMRKFVEHRVGDPRVVRLIQKWLKAGVMENGKKVLTEVGSPQGATISPLLANIYLHYSFDLWAEQWRRRHVSGDMIIVRYADDIVIGFQHEHEARRFWTAMAERLQDFGLTLHSDKTRLIEFGRYALPNRKKRGGGKPETFNFLGFTHRCGECKEKGRFRVERYTIKERMRETLKRVTAVLRRNRHAPVAQQGKWLGQVIRGYLAYYAVPLNRRLMNVFRNQVIRSWTKWLRRRSHKHALPWRRMQQLIRRFIPSVRVMHPWPSQRFSVRTQGRSPVR